MKCYETPNEGRYKENYMKRHVKRHVGYHVERNFLDVNRNEN